MNQVNYDSVFIPQKIELSIGLKKEGIPLEENHPKPYEKVRKIFDVSKEEMFPLSTAEKKTNGEILFDKKETIIEGKKLKGFSQLVLMTEIQIYEDEKIGIDESGLTTPIIIKDISDLKDSLSIHTQYKISSHPELEYKIT
tara:strand:- start:85 stop:507 length:423 start_codon:yes stop_codon:yes gene_type:complete